MRGGGGEGALGSPQNPASAKISESFADNHFTRIWVSLVLDMLAAGTTEAELRAEYPQLVHDDVLAAIAYSANRVRH